MENKYTYLLLKDYSYLVRLHFRGFVSVRCYIHSGNFFCWWNYSDFWWRFWSRRPMWRKRSCQTSHVDHANVLYQIPEKETGLPMVFLHGYGQSRMGWMTTPDWPEGWYDMFLRNGHSVFLMDEPRRGEAVMTFVSRDIS